jgi:chromate transport protein ChrA
MVLNLLNGVRFQVAEHLGAAWFGIAFVVPAMLVIHLLIFAFLLSDRKRSANNVLHVTRPSGTARGVAGLGRR